MAIYEFLEFFGIFGIFGPILWTQTATSSRPWSAYTGLKSEVKYGGWVKRQKNDLKSYFKCVKTIQRRILAQEVKFYVEKKNSKNRLRPLRWAPESKLWLTHWIYAYSCKTWTFKLGQVYFWKFLKILKFWYFNSLENNIYYS